MVEAIASDIANMTAYNGTEKQIMLGTLATLGKQILFHEELIHV